MTNELSREEWLEERRRGIGGSDWMNALSLEPYGCQRQLVYDKRGIEPDFPDEQPEGYLIRGHKLEPLVVEEAEAQLLIKCRRQTRLARPDWIPEWWIGNIDRMVVGGGVFEAKTKNPWVFKKLKSEGIPLYEFAQMQHYMALADREDCVYAALEPVSWELYVDHVVRDDELIKKMLLAGEWLWGIVQDEELELPERLDASSKKCKRCPWRWYCQGEAIFSSSKAKADEPVERQLVNDPDMVELAREVYELREIAAEAKERLAELTNTAKRQLGGPGRYNIDGHAVNWLSYTERRFQTGPFKKSHPDLYDKFTKENNKEAFRWD